MISAQLVFDHFPELNATQRKQIEMLYPLYEDWNSKINVVSRKDIEMLYLHHVLHSLVIAKFVTFNKNIRVLDLGTGGGFPGIPLAIYFPEAKFTLVDSIAKKIKVVDEVSKALELKNVTAIHTRVEDVKDKFDYVVTRAVAPAEELIKWTRKSFDFMGKGLGLAEGIIALKGGDLTEELKAFKKHCKVKPLSTWYKEDFFETKSLVYIKV